MKKIMRSTVEALHYFFSGDADDNNEVPYKNKLSGVVLYSVVIGVAILLYWLLQQR